MLIGMHFPWVSHDDLAFALPSWSGAQHLAALRRHIVPGPGAPELDVEGYAAELLVLTSVPQPRWAALVPVALWWAIRPDLGPARCDGRWVELYGGTRVRVDEYSWVERCEAAQNALFEEDDDELDPAAVVERVLAQVVEHVDESGVTALADLSAPAVVQLAAAMLDRYHCQHADDPFEDLDAERARLVLALHCGLGR
jgi:hypothetical protein